MPACRYLLVKAHVGFGDRHQCLSHAMQYAVKYGRILCVDWGDSVWSDGTVDFHTVVLEDRAEVGDGEAEDARAREHLEPAPQHGRVLAAAHVLEDVAGVDEVGRARLEAAERPDVADAVDPRQGAGVDIHVAFEDFGTAADVEFHGGLAPVGFRVAVRAAFRRRIYRCPVESVTEVLRTSRNRGSCRNGTVSNRPPRACPSGIALTSRSGALSALASKRVLVTGGAGFLGRNVCEAIRERGPAAIVVPRKAEYDLTEQALVRRLLDDARPDTVIHLAANSCELAAAETCN